ncbi:hypothetical protein Pla22_16200 [Rubripirellula amarantea]|uniref:YscD cytoplasmic domain-containing protein n=1 Tax=Rubripirellula amarantea TaxID=2527999 RepID=A0A5C5WTI6_9BACT|nr:FHA domain-containing protein [Rubripirellula amarantea]TWT53986.1 hypothetical protein Pla22_16200 [Rubripirellula amarantea]
MSGPRVDAIEFRVSRAGSSIRRLRLTGNRYTFGSAEGCSIRLNDSDLRPMHAVLIREEARVVVRAYSVPIEVNGESTTESSLVVGDRLRLGEYEFELISVPVRDMTAGEASRQTSRPTDESRLENRHFDQRFANTKPRFSSAKSFDYPTDPSSTSEFDETAWRQRLRREIDQWRAKHVECDEREQRIDEREAHLRGRESELWSRAENLYRREAQLQSQESAVYQLHDEYAQRQQELMRLRDEARSQQEKFRKRESEFAKQEFEYQRQLESAATQLAQSHTQAEAATEAVRKIRQQFDALNEQIEALSIQQSELKDHENHQREQHQQLRLELESQRDNAIDAQAESEARRREADARVEEMSAELEMLKLTQGELSDAEREEIAVRERTIEELREQIQTLQCTVDSAESESSRLRANYQEALESVSQLESLVAQSNERGDRDRDAWALEADSLRSEIERLSDDLSRTSEEIRELREANQTLTSRLEKVQQQRDDAVEDLKTRPSKEQLDLLQEELDAAHAAVEALQQEWKAPDADPTDQARSSSEWTVSRFADVDNDDRDDSSESGSLAMSSFAESRLDKYAATNTTEMGNEEASVADEAAMPNSSSMLESDNEVLDVADSESESNSLAIVEPEQPSESTLPDAVDEAADEDMNPWTDTSSEVNSVSESVEDDDAVWPTYEISQVDDEVETPDSSASLESPPSIWNPEPLETAGELASDEVVSNELASDEVIGNEITSDDANGFEASGSALEDASEDEVLSSEAVVFDGQPIAEFHPSDADVSDADVPVGESSSPWGDADPWAEEPSSEEMSVQVDDVAGDRVQSSDSMVSGEQSWTGEAVGPELSDANNAEADSSMHDESDDSSELAAGSLASMLIADIESDPTSETNHETNEGESYSGMLGSADSVSENTLSDDDVSSEQDIESSYMGTQVWQEASQEFETPLADSSSSEASDSDSSSSFSAASIVESDEDRDSSQTYAWDRELEEESSSEVVDPGNPWGMAFDEDDAEQPSVAVAPSTDDEPISSVADAMDEVEATSFMSQETMHDVEEQFAHESNSVDSSVSEGELPEPMQSSEMNNVVDAKPSEASSSSAETVAAGDVADDDDDSIEAYMNRLLRRVQGTSSDDKSKPAESLSLSTNPVSLSAESSVPSESLSESIAIPEPVDPNAPLVPRSHAPERNSNLSAMRDLANQSARSAISRSARIQTRNIQIAGIVNFAVAGIAMIFGIGALAMLSGKLPLFILVIAIVVAAISIRDGLRNLSEARQRLSTSKAAVADEVAEGVQEHEEAETKLPE